MLLPYKDETEWAGAFFVDQSEWPNSVENVHKSFEWFSILFETNGKVTSNVNIAERLYLESQLGSTQLDGPLQLGKGRNLLLSSGEVPTESLIR